MPEKFWIQDFETGRDRLRVHFVTERGEVKSILVIQYEAYVDRKWHAIVRYDEAHGFFHRDILSPTGEQEKRTQSAEDKGLVLTAALTELKQNWLAYRKAYEDQYYATRQPSP